MTETENTERDLKTAKLKKQRESREAGEVDRDLKNGVPMSGFKERPDKVSVTDTASRNLIAEEKAAREAKTSKLKALREAAETASKGRLEKPKTDGGKLGLKKGKGR
jgi:hypothetical protein